jgi:Mg-chelatase subunit ChlD
MVARGPTWRQRAIAARSAAGYTGEAGRKAALKALKDKDVRVVIQALLGLRDRKDPETVAPIAKLLSHETWVVQVTAAGALADIGSMKAVRPLIEILGKTTGRVQDDVNEALKKLTGQKFQPDYDQWKAWYDENKDELEGADAKGLGRARKAKKADDSSYYGIKTRSKHIVYVLDISGSMNKEIGGKGIESPKPGEEEKPSGPKIEIAKKELKSAIRQLAPDAKFTIITFNEIVTVWKPKLIEAKQKNKNEAYIYINELEASGSTFTFGALKEAFKLAGMGAVDPHYKSGVNTIFLLSDGMPTDQTFPMAKPMDTEKILKAVRQWNKLSKVVIHAIAIDPNTQGASFIKFMKKLADQNGGKYTERG